MQERPMNEIIEAFTAECRELNVRTKCCMDPEFTYTPCSSGGIRDMRSSLIDLLALSEELIDALFAEQNMRDCLPRTR